MSKHTEGPWRVLHGTDGRPYAITSVTRVGVVNWGGISRPAGVDGEANARLIAAAPDMYEALRTLVIACVESGWPTKAEHTTPMIVARAAIAKVDA